MKQIFWVMLVVALGFLFSGSIAKAADITSIDVMTLEGRMASPMPPFLLDVREPAETAQGIIEGAHLIPLGSLESRLGELPKDKTIVVYCRSGHRSMKAADILMKYGFMNVENLSGGMLAWQAR